MHRAEINWQVTVRVELHQNSATSTQGPRLPRVFTYHLVNVGTRDAGSMAQRTRNWMCRTVFQRASHWHPHSTEETPCASPKSEPRDRPHTFNRRGGTLYYARLRSGGNSRISGIVWQLFLAGGTREKMSRAKWSIRSTQHTAHLLRTLAFQGSI